MKNNEPRRWSRSTNQEQLASAAERFRSFVRTDLDVFFREITTNCSKLPKTRRRRRGHWSVVAGRLLGQLHSGFEPELGVNVGEVRLHGADRDE